MLPSLPTANNKTLPKRTMKLSNHRMTNKKADDDDDDDEPNNIPQTNASDALLRCMGGLPMYKCHNVW